MTSVEWIVLSSSPSVTGKIAADPVLSLYASLANQFTSWNPISWDNCIVGLHIVYAWMPTMVDCNRPDKLTPAEQAKVAKLFNDARSRFLTDNELFWLKQKFSKNSLVGISKILHFINPNRFAIWDSRVANVWLSPSFYSYTKLETPSEYNNYLDTLAKWRSLPSVVPALAALRTLSPHLAAVSDMRLLELPLFHG